MQIEVDNFGRPFVRSTDGHSQYYLAGNHPTGRLMCRWFSPVGKDGFRTPHHMTVRIGRRSDMIRTALIAWYRR